MSPNLELGWIPAVVSCVGYADSAGLGDKGDQLNFSADA
jgi:hypothetical protein